MERLIRFLLFPALACVASAAPAQPYHPSSVERVTLQQAGLSEYTDDDMAMQACKRFQPSTRQIRRFLAHAVEVESRVYTHERYSPCYATGTVDFANGTKAQWQIHSGCTGILKTQTGKTIILYGKTCRWGDPFAGTYGDS